jgi:7-cyano-7-deazaguanine reductase
MSDTSGLSHLGSSARYHYDRPEASILETFANQHPGGGWIVALDCLEFTSLCPMTGQPDWGRIHVHYVPGDRCVESKSLKLYLGAYRNHGAFHEDCINRIADDLTTAMAPRLLRVYGDFRPRGGIAIRPLTMRTAPDMEPGERARCLELLAVHDSMQVKG